MIGAGAVATRLLAGAWFGFDLLWVALLRRADGDLHARLRVARRRCSPADAACSRWCATDIGAWLAWVDLPADWRS